MNIAPSESGTQIMQVAICFVMAARRGRVNSDTRVKQDLNVLREKQPASQQ